MGRTEGSRWWAPQWLGARERGRVRAGVGADPVCGAAGVREKGEGEQRSGQLIAFSRVDSHSFPFSVPFGESLIRVTDQ